MPHDAARPPTTAEIVTGRRRGPGRLQRLGVPEHVLEILRARHGRAIAARRLLNGGWIFLNAEGRHVDGSWNLEEHRRVAVTWIEFHERQYGRTQNPLFAWIALSEARAVKLLVPEWVLEYLTRGAQQFAVLTRAGVPVPKKPAPAIAAALEFKKPGRSGRGNPFRRYRDLARPVLLAMRVDRYLRGGVTLERALRDTAEQEGLSEETVARAWKQERRAFTTGRRKSPTS